MSIKIFFSSSQVLLEEKVHQKLVSFYHKFVYVIKKKNTFQFHSPLKVNGCILYWDHLVP